MTKWQKIKAWYIVWFNLDWDIIHGELPPGATRNLIYGSD